MIRAEKRYAPLSPAEGPWRGRLRVTAPQSGPFPLGRGSVRDCVPRNWGVAWRYWPRHGVEGKQPFSPREPPPLQCPLWLMKGAPRLFTVIGWCAGMAGGGKPRQTASRRRRRQRGRCSRRSKSMCMVRVISRVGWCFLTRRASPRVAEMRIAMHRDKVCENPWQASRLPSYSPARVPRVPRPCTHEPLCLHLYTQLTFVLQRIESATPLSRATPWARWDLFRV